jgi:hypothetical protein
MYSEDKFWIILIVCITIFLCTLTICGFTDSYYSRIAAFEHGYEKTAVMGSDILTYQKVR